MSLEFVMNYKHGRLQMGNPYGAASLDKHWVFKKNFTVILGTPGSGKTTVAVYLNLVQAILQDKKCLVWSSENSDGVLKIMCINAIIGGNLQNVSDEHVSQTHDLLAEYMYFADTSKTATMYSIMDAMERKLNDGFHSCVIDPFSSLKMDDDKKKFTTEYNYHYNSITDLRNFQKRTGVAVWLCVHPVTEAQRRRHKDDHEYAGLTPPPGDADAEQGGMFNNRTDDYVVAHRYKGHEEDWNKTFLHILKIKEELTGGKPTPLTRPVEMKFDGYRFFVDGVDILQEAINQKWTNT